MDNDLEQEGSTETLSEEVAELNQARELDNLSEDELEGLLSGIDPEQKELEEASPELPEPSDAAEKPQEEATAQASQDIVAELHQRIDGLQKIIGERSTEVGRLRSALRDAIANKEKSISDLEIDSPMDAVKATLELEKLKEQEAALGEEDLELATRARFYQTVPKVVPNEQFDLTAIREELLSDGIESHKVEKFIQQIDLQVPETVINVAKRAHYAKALKKLVPYLQQVIAERDELKARNVDKGDKIAKSISQQLKKTQPTNVGKPMSKNVSVESVNPDSLSDEELDELIKRGSVNGRNNI